MSSRHYLMFLKLYTEKLMRRKLKAFGLILCVTVLIAVTYVGISRLIEAHVANEVLSFPIFETEVVDAAAVGNFN